MIVTKSFDKLSAVGDKQYPLLGLAWKDKETWAMGSVRKKTFTKSVPHGAEIFTLKGKRFAKWKPPKGKTQTAPLVTGKDGSDRIVLKSKRYLAKYRDGSGIVRERATGCRDREAALRKLADWERRAESVEAGVMSTTEDANSDDQATPLTEHFDAYIDHQKAKGLAHNE